MDGCGEMSQAGIFGVGAIVKEDTRGIRRERETGAKQHPNGPTRNSAYRAFPARTWHMTRNYWKYERCTYSDAGGKSKPA